MNPLKVLKKIVNIHKTSSKSSKKSSQKSSKKTSNKSKSSRSINSSDNQQKTRQIINNELNEVASIISGNEYISKSLYNKGKSYLDAAQNMVRYLNNKSEQKSLKKAIKEYRAALKTGYSRYKQAKEQQSAAQSRTGGTGYARTGAAGFGGYGSGGSGGGGGYSGGDSDGGAGNGGDGSDNQDPEKFDWIQVKIKRVEREITNLDAIVDGTYKNWGDRNTALGSELSKVSEEIAVQQQGYARYMKEADSVGLSADLKQKVQNGTIDIQSIKDEDVQKKVQEYQQW